MRQDNHNPFKSIEWGTCSRGRTVIGCLRYKAHALPLCDRAATAVGGGTLRLGPPPRMHSLSQGGMLNPHPLLAPDTA